MKTIGIKLADGSFYPVLEEDNPAEKSLELTTAHNNQTKIMVDLYRSKACSMDDAEYVDSLQIENLVAHPNGEPNIAFTVSIDENNELSANIIDPETGKQSNTTITLVSRTLEERLNTDEYDISDAGSDDVEKSDNIAKAAAAGVAGIGLMAAAGRILEKEKEDEKSENTDNFSNDTNPEITEDITENSDEPVVIDEPPADDFELPDEITADDIGNFDENIEEVPVEEPVQEAEIVSETETEPDMAAEPEMTVPESEAEIVSEMTAEPEMADSESEESTIEDIPDFDDLELDNFDIDKSADDEIISDEEDSSDNDFKFEDENIDDVIPSSDIDDILSDKTEEVTETTDNGSDEISPDTIDDFNLDDLDLGEIDNSKTDDFDISDITEPEADDLSIDDIAEPEVDDLSIDDITEPETDDLSIDDIAEPEADDLSIDDIAEPEAEETTFDLPDDIDNTKSGEDITSDDKFFGNNFGELGNDDDTLPDFDNIENDNSETEALAVDAADSVPDDLEIEDEPVIDTNFDDDFFNDPSFDESINSTSNVTSNNSSSDNGAGGLSFTGLYDKETEMGEPGKQDDDSGKKTKAPVIICIICAIICIIATLLILFIIPSKYNLINKKTAETEEVIELVPEVKQETVTETPTEPEKEIVPEAKEDEVVIIEKAEEVVPEQPEIVEEKLEDISYKITWGDTLWDIADTYYKNPWRYKYIARYNGIKNPDHIISGTYITIPAE